MWRNVYYDKKTSVIHESTWDEDGNRVDLAQKFKPFLMIENRGGVSSKKYKSIYGTDLEAKSFRKDYERYKFTENYDGKIFFNLPVEQQYLIGKYRTHDKEKFADNPIRTFFFDIEAPSFNEFPDPREARYEIDLMTIYDSLDGKFHMWGKKAWDKGNMKDVITKMGGNMMSIEEDDIIYYEIWNEAERLDHFLEFWKNNTPEILTGWNSDKFDIPYIVNRIKLVLKEKRYQELSPFKDVKSRDGFDRFGNPELTYKIGGINLMDYMDVFKTFTMGAERESWKLDDVATDVVECGKVPYDGGNLAVLARDDWDTYSVYNLVDVALIVSMDRVKDFISIGRSTAYEGFSNYKDCLGKVVTITGSIACSALNDGKIIETRKREEKVPFEGGFVKPPKFGLASNILTFDVTSLYPTIMMILGVSLETKVGSVLGSRENPDGYLTFTEYGETKRIRTDKFEKYLRDRNWCISPDPVNAIFDKNIEGVVNAFVRKQFNNKSEYGRLAKEAELAGDAKMVEHYNKLKQITKIFLNSCYGVISTNTSSLYDLEIARSITLTGQASIKEAVRLANDFSSEKFGCEEDVVYGGDTDSIFVNLTEVVESIGKPMFTENGMSKTGAKLSSLYEKLLNNGVNDWAKANLYVTDPTFNFEREKAATTALFFAKKQYAYHVLNNEGFDLPEGKRMKYTGLKVIKSEYSPMVKRMMDDIYFGSLSNYLKMGSKATQKHIADILREQRKEFFAADFYSTTKRQKSNQLMKYEEQFISPFVNGKSCPVQVKAALFCNHLIDELKLESIYQKHSSGAKIMWAYVKENKWGINCCAGVNGKLPPEFELEVDHEKMWNSLYLKAANQLFEAVDGWHFPVIKYEELESLDDLFF